MKALAVFHNEGIHPLARFLKPGFKHCFVVLAAGDYWIRIDAMDGIPVAEVVAPADYDLCTFYRKEGFSVIETQQGVQPWLWPLVTANCVGLVVAVLAIRPRWVWTPWQLSRYLSRRQYGLLPGKSNFNPVKPITDILTTPKPDLPPPVEPTPPLPEREDPAVLDVARKQRDAELRRRGRASTILTGAGGALDTAPLGRPTASSGQLGA